MVSVEVLRPSHFSKTTTTGDDLAGLRMFKQIPLQRCQLLESGKRSQVSGVRCSVFRKNNPIHSSVCRTPWGYSVTDRCSPTTKSFRFSSAFPLFSLDISQCRTIFQHKVMADREKVGGGGAFLDLRHYSRLAAHPIADDIRVQKIQRLLSRGLKALDGSGLGISKSGSGTKSSRSPGANHSLAADREYLVSLFLIFTSLLLKRNALGRRTACDRFPF